MGGKALCVLVPAWVSQKQHSHRLPTFLLCEGQRPPAGWPDTAPAIPAPHP